MKHDVNIGNNNITKTKGMDIKNSLEIKNLDRVQGILSLDPKRLLVNSSAIPVASPGCDCYNHGMV